jgi:hypothetical protein
MTRDEFWRLIEQARPPDNDPDLHCQAMTNLLATLKPEEILHFEYFFSESFLQAYRADLWSIMSEIDTLCSDDAFMDFRAWLIMQGQDVFETVLAAPDYLGEITLEGCVMSHEPFNYMAGYAYERKTGEPEMPDFTPPDHPRLGAKHRRLKGRFIKSERAFRRRWPVLWRLLTDRPDIDPTWLTWRDGLVRSMAQTIEKERRWCDLPVLADALEEAGCTERLILDHCRAAGTRHARTCWVINFLLGRK